MDIFTRIGLCRVILDIARKSSTLSLRLAKEIVDNLFSSPPEGEGIPLVRAPMGQSVTDAITWAYNYKDAYVDDIVADQINSVLAMTWLEVEIGFEDVMLPMITLLSNQSEDETY